MYQKDGRVQIQEFSFYTKDGKCFNSLSTFLGVIFLRSRGLNTSSSNKFQKNNKISQAKFSNPVCKIFQYSPNCKEEFRKFVMVILQICSKIWWNCSKELISENSIFNGYSMEVLMHYVCNCGGKIPDGLTLHTSYT